MANGKIREKFNPSNLKSLSALNERFEFILEGAGLGAWDWCLKTNEVYFDRRWCQMIGISFENVTQHLDTWQSRVHPDDLASCFADIQRYLKGETQVYENIHRMRHADGRWIWILDRGRIAEWDQDGKPFRFVGTHFDITAMKELERKTNEIQNHAQIGAWELDVRTGKTTWTAGVYAIHAISTDIPTDKVMGINFFAPHEREKIARNVQECLQNGISYRERYDFIDAVGTSKQVEVIGRPVFDANDQIIKLFGTIQDVSELRKAQDLLKMEMMKSAQSAKLASLGELAAGMAHEINNPIAIIKATCEAIKIKMNDGEYVRKKVESILQASKRVEKIVKGLRKFSRTSEASQRGEHDLTQIVRDSLVIIEPKFKIENVELLATLTEGCLINCDPIEIEQVLVNILSNAIDASDTSKKNDQSKWVKLVCRIENEFAVCRISDSGHGVLDSIEAKIFEPFFTTKEVGKGTGLGLSISKGIMQTHGGDLFLNRTISNSCFEIRLPLSAARRMENIFAS